MTSLSNIAGGPAVTEAGDEVVMRPPTERGPLAWTRRNLFSSWTSGITTGVMVTVLVWIGYRFLDWAVLRAIWTLPGSSIADTQLCRAETAGACWALIHEKYRFILFGLYPYAEQWRPTICIAAFIGLYVVSVDRRLWGWKIAAVWLAGLTAIFILMRGGVFGLRPVSEDLWGGLPVTLMLATFGIALAFPLAILVALGRASETNPTVRTLCTLYVEIIRGIPLISVLFMASVMFPLFLPEGLTVSKLLRAQLGIVIFVAAYLSETIRGGLQAVPSGQYEAAKSLGLGYWRMTALVIMPQALTIVLPPIVSLCIAFFKHTSLVMIIGIFDLLNAAKRSIGEPAWQGFGAEAYIFVAAIYFAFCFAMSRYGQRLEKRLKRSR
ncbi:amino acid ABC transporter permease [Aquamicrobium sp. LC103]|uniref:amino acid ABC transporter permease n=1 Tax=Aquamicrobium sp. LC103 TaxID=1120658 RepID=UPI0010C9D985|nr:amino acid ABC transporter permease [Aquamicrobium sp. LC103]TKT81031.1 amino acid ABC transporter permease [Aquamicrobium sp. LC103]